MSNELTPLKSNSHHEQEDAYEDAYEDEEWSSFSKYSVIAAGSIFCILCVYLFAFYLPSVFIPEATSLNAITKVGRAEYHLSPLSDERVKELGLNKFEVLKNDDANAEQENLFGEEIKQEDEDEDEVDEGIGKSIGHNIVERLILIGDIHGEFKHLQKLLKKIKFNSKKDHVILLGDFISKGPNSLKVLDWAIENNIGCVLGNHEFYVLENYARFHNLDSPWFIEKSNGSLLEVPERYIQIKDKFNDDPEYLLAKKLLPRHVKYINNCPVIKKLGKVPFHNLKHNNGTKKSIEGVAVHAGLNWDLYDDLEHQNPLDCLEMRKLVPPFFNETTDDSHYPGAIPWTKKWQQTMKKLPLKNKTCIYYGHDARKGLSLKKYTKGLDSRCNAGGFLTAMVLWREQSQINGKLKTLYKEQPFHVKC